MGKGFKHGGSASGISEHLGFKIMKCSPDHDLPDTAENNTIAVFTDDDIVSCQFSRNLPREFGIGDILGEATGRLLIVSGKYSPAYFDIDNGINSMRIYPIHVYQEYWGNTSNKNVWKPKDAKVYRNGKWFPLKTYLYKDGNQCESVTGGWDRSQSGGCSASPDDDHFYLGWDNKTTGYASISTANKIDISEHANLVIIFESLANKSGNPGVMVHVGKTKLDNLFSNTDTGDYQVNYAITTNLDTSNWFYERTICVDLMSLHYDNADTGNDQELYIQLAVQKSSAYIKEIYLCGDKFSAMG